MKNNTNLDDDNFVMRLCLTTAMKDVLPIFQK